MFLCIIALVYLEELLNMEAIKEPVIRVGFSKEETEEFEKWLSSPEGKEEVRVMFEKMGKTIIEMKPEDVLFP